MRQRFFLFLSWALLWPLLGVANPQTAGTKPNTGASPSTVALGLTEIRSLMQAGRLDEASREIARQLQKPDPEPNLLLLQCVVMAHQNQTDKAIVCLSALVKARPDMLEAYNNLGVLHASLGQHEDAQRWLTLALQRMPTLWTVHQNLQSLQADLSRKAYARALQTELPLKDATPRLTLLATTALYNPVKAALAPAPTTTVATTSPALTASSPVSATSTASKAQTSSKPPLAEKSPASRAEAVATTKPEAPKPEATASSKTEASKADTAQTELAQAKAQDEATRQQLQSAVTAWAKAWSEQNMAAYFAAYAPGYTPSKSVSRANWKAERTARIVDRQYIKVMVSNFSFDNKSGKATVRFNQIYESDNIRSSHRKRLEMEQFDGRWKIVRETVITP